MKQFQVAASGDWELGGEGKWKTAVFQNKSCKGFCLFRLCMYWFDFFLNPNLKKYITLVWSVQNDVWVWTNILIEVSVDRFHAPKTLEADWVPPFHCAEINLR